MTKRNITWKHEELILAVTCYLKMKKADRRLRASDPEAEKLSEQLSKLKLHSSAPNSTSFRSPDAVAMQVNGFAVHDEHALFKARPTSGSRSERVWDTYSDNLDAAEAMSEAVLKAF